MHVSDLCLEITRRCNMRCAHCLRGEPQRAEMSVLTMEKVFAQINSVGNLLFTGGEPSLAPFKMTEARIICKRNRIDVSGLMLVTNGKYFSREFKIELEAWKNYTDEMYIAVSRDQFHDMHIPENHLEWLEDLTESEVCVRSSIPASMIIPEGRGYYVSGFQKFAQRSCAGFSFYGKDDGEFDLEGEIYVNALGQVIDGGDFSYESQEDHIICTVDDNIIEAMKEHYRGVYERALAHRERVLQPA